MLKIFLLVLFTIANFFGLLATLLVLYPVAILAFKKKTSPIYIIAFSNLCIDTIQLLVSIGYCLPSYILDNQLFSGDRYSLPVKIVSDIVIFCWYTLTTSQLFTAINRFVVVCFPRHNIFTSKVVFAFLFLQQSGALIITVITQHILPCCAFSVDFELYSYSYNTKENIPNYTNTYVDLPLNSATSIISALCYVSIFVYVKKSSASSSLSKAARSQRRMKENVYAFQFCLISIIYLCCWVLFRIWPQTVFNWNISIYWLMLTPICIIFNSSANSTVYLITNTEVRQIVRNVFRKGNAISAASNSKGASDMTKYST